MEYIEEGKALIDGFEIPVQYIDIYAKKSKSFHTFHYHEYIELLYGLDCDARVWINGDIISFKSGDLVIVNSKKAHTVMSVSEKSRYAVIKFMPQILYAAEQSVFEFKYLLPFITEDLNHRKLFYKNELENTVVPKLMENIANEWQKKEYGYEIALRNDTVQIALWLIRKWHSENKLPEINATNESIRCVQKAIQYAQNNYGIATSFEAAKLCNLSYSYFSRLFKRIMKRSFTEYVNSIRMNESKRMLVSEDMSITDIALECGFSTTSYYIEQFKKENGITPAKFRKNKEL